MQPYTIALHIYADSTEEAKELEDTLKAFVVQKYNQGVYPRAASLSKLVKQYGNMPLVINFLR